MLKKCAILGVAVVSLGGIALAWGHYRMQAEHPQRQGPPKGSLRSQEYISKYGRWYELAPEDQTRLVFELDADQRAKTPRQLAQERQERLQADIDKLATGEMVPSEIVNYLYGPDWQQELTRYREQTELTRNIQAAAVVSVSFGAGLFALSLLAALARLIVRAIRNAKARRMETGNTQPATPGIQSQIENPPLSASDIGQMSPDCEISSPPSEQKHRKRAQRRSVAVEPVPETPWNQGAVCVIDHSFDIPSEPNGTGSSVAVETLRDQAEDLQRQIAAFKTAAQSAQQATLEKSAPLNDTLKELTEQVSAIRDYAASQQDRMRKLQDGYDWGIIRTFCLRVIRCIDNLDGRIDEFTEAGAPAEHLQEVRDELLFALESSGIEQFEPEFGTDYRGQEKYAEAVKEKEPSGRPDQAGTIAKVLRPGYRYVMDEENFKVVRTAQVMLFGCEDE